MALDKTPSTPEIHAVLQNVTLRYSQVWEDYKLLFDGLDLEPADHVVSIGSAATMHWRCCPRRCECFVGRSQSRPDHS